MGLAALCVVGGAALLVGVPAQEMPGKAMTCWDKQELCNLNCVAPHPRVDAPQGLAWPYNVPDTYADMMNCQTLCSSTAEACEDSDETADYVTCAYSCAQVYDSALTSCNQAVPRGTKYTYGQNLDACANLAGGDMDDCMEDCYGADRFEGWTPEKEEGGNPVLGIKGNEWRRPFREPHVIYGANWERFVSSDEVITAETQAVPARSAMGLMEGSGSSSSFGAQGVLNIMATAGLMAGCILAVGAMVVVGLSKRQSSQQPEISI